jgi:hypothetical protein
MMEEEGIVDGKVKELPHKMVTEWLVGVPVHIPGEVGRIMEEEGFQMITN